MMVVNQERMLDVMICKHDKQEFILTLVRACSADKQRPDVALNLEIAEMVKSKPIQ